MGSNIYSRITQYVDQKMDEAARLMLSSDKGDLTGIDIDIDDLANAINDKLSPILKDIKAELMQFIQEKESDDPQEDQSPELIDDPWSDLADKYSLYDRFSEPKGITRAISEMFARITLDAISKGKGIDPNTPGYKILHDRLVRAFGYIIDMTTPLDAIDPLIDGLIPYQNDTKSLVPQGSEMMFIPGSYTEANDYVMLLLNKCCSKMQQELENISGKIPSSMPTTSEIKSFIRRYS